MRLVLWHTRPSGTTSHATPIDPLSRDSFIRSYYDHDDYFRKPTSAQIDIYYQCTGNYSRSISRDFRDSQVRFCMSHGIIIIISAKWTEWNWHYIYTVFTFVCLSVCVHRPSLTWSKSADNYVYYQPPIPFPSPLPYPPPYPFLSPLPLFSSLPLHSFATPSSSPIPPTSSMPLTSFPTLSLPTPCSLSTNPPFLPFPFRGAPLSLARGNYGASYVVSLLRPTCII